MSRVTGNISNEMPTKVGDEVTCRRKVAENAKTTPNGGGCESGERKFRSNGHEERGSYRRRVPHNPNRQQQASNEPKDEQKDEKNS